MPLVTSIVRDGKALKLRWGQYHVAAMIVAAAADSGKGPWTDNSRRALLNPDGPTVITAGLAMRIVSYPYIAETPLDSDGYVLTGEYRFADERDGEELVLKPGDKLIAYRD